MKSQLKTISSYMVYNSNLRSQAKSLIFSWLENEATEIQMKAFLLEGKIMKVDKQSYDIINSRFENKYDLNEVWPIVAGAASALAIFQAARQVYARYYSAAAKACRGNPNKAFCMISARIKAEQAKLAMIRRDMSKCNKAANVKKCQKTLQGHMKTIEKKIVKLQTLRAKKA